MSFLGYVLFRRARAKKDNVKGGGVLLCVREGFGAVLEIGFCGNVSESLWIKIQSKARRYLYIGVCYRSPTASKEGTHELFINIQKMLNIQH